MSPSEGGDAIPSTVTPTRTRIRHPVFYFRDGSVVLMVTDNVENKEVLYRLHASILEHRSTVFKDIFSLPFGNPLRDSGDGQVLQPTSEGDPGNTLALEGRSDDHPFELPAANVTPAKFNDLVLYLYTGTSNHPDDIPFLLNVLDMSSYFDIADGVQYVIQALEFRSNFSAVQRFKLARTYNIHQWVEPAIRDLLEWDTIALTLADVFDIGPEAFHQIIQAKSKIQRLRIGMAYKPPELVKGPRCQAACEYAWRREWWNEIARYILHPQWMATGSAIKQHLKLTDIPGVCQSCRDTTVEAMELKGAFEKDTEIVEGVVMEVKKAHGDFTPARYTYRTALNHYNYL